MSSLLDIGPDTPSSDWQPRNAPTAKITIAEDAALFAGFLGKYEAGGARYFVVDVNYYGLMSNDVQKYLDAAHERLTLGEGFAVWRLRRVAGIRR